MNTCLRNCADGSFAAQVAMCSEFWCAGGQVKPVGQESMNLDTVEKLTVGRDRAWVQLPSLLKRR